MILLCKVSRSAETVQNVVSHTHTHTTRTQFSYAEGAANEWAMQSRASVAVRLTGIGCIVRGLRCAEAARDFLIGPTQMSARKDTLTHTHRGKSHWAKTTHFCLTRRCTAGPQSGCHWGGSTPSWIGASSGHGRNLLGQIRRCPKLSLPERRPVARRARIFGLKAPFEHTVYRARWFSYSA